MQYLFRGAADRFEKPRNGLRTHFRSGEGQPPRVLQRGPRPKDIPLVGDDEAVVADSADGLRELAALRPECPVP